MRMTKRFVVFFLAAAIVSAFSTALALSLQAHEHTKLELKREVSSRIGPEYFRYGIITSIDQNEKVFVLRAPNRFSPSDPPIDLSVRVDAETLVEEVYLEFADGIASGLGAPVERSLSDIPLGARAAVWFFIDEEARRLDARLIQFGAPL